MRANGEGKGNTITGYAAVFNSPSQLIRDSFFEIVKPGSFKRSLAIEDRDIICVVEHDVTKIIGRKSSGTLRVEEDDTGLRFECDLPDTTYANDLKASIDRGDIAHMSFGVQVNRDNWEIKDGGMRVRELYDCDLYEVSTTFDPAYLDAELALRSLEKFTKESVVVDRTEIETLLLKNRVKDRLLRLM